jgi:hypothetical protein
VEARGEFCYSFVVGLKTLRDAKLHCEGVSKYKWMDGRVGCIEGKIDG